jgi:hypothetical protein
VAVVAVTILTVVSWLLIKLPKELTDACFVRLSAGSTIGITIDPAIVDVDGKFAMVLI